MALPDYFKAEQGTAVVWGEAGASGVTATLSFDGLADGSARMGASVDLGAQWDQEYVVQLVIESGTAPTAGTTVDLFLVGSTDGTNFAGGVSGSDGAWPADGNEDEWAKQIASAYVGSLIATNDGTTVQRQSHWIWRPKARYVAPVVDNNLGQAVRDETTATDNDSRVIITPRRSLVQDAA